MNNRDADLEAAKALLLDATTWLEAGEAGDPNGAKCYQAKKRVADAFAALEAADKRLKELDSVYTVEDLALADREAGSTYHVWHGDATVSDCLVCKLEAAERERLSLLDAMEGEFDTADVQRERDQLRQRIAELESQLAEKRELAEPVWPGGRSDD